jgi:hypothetical protein
LDLASFLLGPRAISPLASSPSSSSSSPIVSRSALPQLVASIATTLGSVSAFSRPAREGSRTLRLASASA